ncbi:hypothetical protein CALVIDRAFT_569477 [Calocera viscosa TUFC12733]|uniref:Uncharacterized protein n=1 Tax=Calocera viscosa (strain TUFC12733) TaxID=1330018 RepID=A0A167FY31_CALVF|nr:hypothetical protein CALVIDRAFT_569477 [Calocera viscosa TUFC12733]
MFAEDGTYKDAFATANGRDEIGGQFYGLPRSRRRGSWHFVRSVSPDGKIEMDLHQVFVFKAGGKEVDMKTTVIIYSDRNWRDHQMLQEINVVVTPHLFGTPQTEEQDAKKLEHDQNNQ